MPVDWAKYPTFWKRLSNYVRFKRARGRCEWRYPNGSRCAAKHLAPHPVTGSKVILTVAHLDHDTEHNLLANLMAMCQLHHNRYDMEFRKANRRRTMEAKKAPRGVFIDVPRKNRLSGPPDPRLNKPLATTAGVKSLAQLNNMTEDQVIAVLNGEDWRGVANRA